MNGILFLRIEVNAQNNCQKVKDHEKVVKEARCAV